MSSGKGQKNLEAGAGPPGGTCRAFGRFTLDERESSLSREGQPIALAPKAFEALRYLVDRPGQLTTRGELMTALWPDSFVEDSNLTSTIWTIRRALGPEVWIETVPKRGYRFVGDVTQLRQHADSGRDSEPVRLLAVLPFRPVVPQQRDEVLEVGMADTLITRLGALRNVVVRPIGAVRMHHGPDQDPLAVGRRLGVDTIVEGSIQRDAGRVRITVRLLEVPSGRMMWAHAFDLTFNDIFGVQDLIAEQVVSALELPLTGADRLRLIRRHTTSVDAYQLYLEGRHAWHRWPLPGYDASRDCFERAIAIDPHYVHAYIGLTRYFGLGAAMGLLRPSDAWPRAEIATATALRLDDDLGDTYNSVAALFLYVHRDWPAAERAFRRALELNPNDAETRNHYGFSLMLFGRTDDAIEELGHAVKIDPLALRFHRNLGFVLYQSQQYDAAIDRYQRVLDLDPSYTSVHELIGDACEQKGLFAEAVAHWTHAVTSSRAIIADGVAELTTEQFSAALQALWRPRLDRLSDRLGRGEYVPPMEMARASARLGNVEEAVSWLIKACEVRDRLILELPLDPQFDTVRGDPRVEMIVSSLPNGHMAHSRDRTVRRSR
jgi:DNA-binding winged helix-turn-helix (wHTH) protein/tetratricopeptide (TPR) repeat protein